MKRVFQVGSCTFGLIHVEPDGTLIYEVSRHGMLISYRESFPANANISDFIKWVSDHGYD